MMFTETLTVVAVSAAPAMPTTGAAMSTPVAPMLLVTVRNATGTNTFSFQDVEANAELYYFGAQLTHTIAPVAATPAATATPTSTTTS